MNNLYCNESVLSWVFRQLNRKCLSEEKVRVIKKIVEAEMERCANGASKLYEIDPAKLRGLLLMPSELYRAQYESFWPIVPFYNRTSYCPHCLMEDMQTIHECYWRCDWEHYWYVICLRHGGRMVDIPNANYTFETLGNKFGDAFADALKCSPIDQQRFIHAWHGDLRPWPWYRASQESDATKPITVFKLAINSLAFILQRFVAKHLNGTEVKFGCLPVIQDLMKLAMRPTTEFCDSFPIAHLISQRLGLKKYGKTKWIDIGVDEFLKQADRYSSVWIRLIAMGVTCYVLQLERSNYWWVQLVQSCRELGHTLPGSPEQVYRSLLGGSYWGLREWFELRHGAGPGFRALFGDRMYGI
ncbi:hypothetical protein C4K22_3219 [Pseudomonas chlororaphis subsp. aurantiaca]|uniref:hypothetical protein n=2 Tax=Pseudomonas chlororaphis TaxID=587753 RepID=UPI000F56D52C|nr:hypothetical protein [Pseudomonas chlororaphis]AZD35962.1 hypothetical protein C4K22_3219 [Pseudomonas chlororaphis subsp. aurantiaca]AZD42299.1 hypothetical protein C4K21_3225 [Pseudomonas chlororaphis subsp. aurantiaca]